MDFRYTDYIGQTIDSRYTPRIFLAQGGFGAVYRGTHDLLGEKIRDVAIKIIKKPIPKGEETTIFAEAILQMTLEEALQANRQMEKIARVHDFGIWHKERRLGYIIMEFIDGSDLRAEMAIHSGSMPESTALRYIIPICEAMGALHRLPRPIIHRDLKPENVLLTADKIIKICDFGLAVRLNQTFGWAEGVAGTQVYMAPETLQGISTCQSDVFSIGAIWYEMLTERLPFDDSIPPHGKEDQQAASWRFQRRKNMIPPHPRLVNNYVSERFARIIQKCLKFNPMERYRDAHELLEAILGDLQSCGSYADAAENAYADGSMDEAAELAEQGLLRCEEEAKLHSAAAVGSLRFRLKYILACAASHTGKWEYRKLWTLFTEIKQENIKCHWLDARKEIELLERELAIHRNAAGAENKCNALNRKINELRNK